MPCRVAHLTSVHLPTDTRIFHKQCKTLARAGYDVTLIAPHAAGDVERDGVKVKAVKPSCSRTERFTNTIRSVYFAALEVNASIYHFHDPELIPVGVLLKMHGKRVIYDVHEDYTGGMEVRQWIPKSMRGATALALNFYERLLARSCDRIVAATPIIANKFWPDRTRVVCNFPLKDELRAPESIPYDQREPVVAFVGALGDARGVRQMIEAAHIVSRQTPVKLMLGGPPLASGARASFEAKNQDGLVEFLGFLSRPEIADLFARARIGIMTPLATRNAYNALPTKLFEYMSAALPIITSDFPLYREIFGSVKCGLFVDPESPEAIAEAILWLLRHPADAAQMGRNGERVIADKYNWEHEADTLLATYAELQSLNSIRLQ